MCVLRHAEITMKCFEEIPGDVVSKEALICILALSYEYVDRDSLIDYSVARWLTQL